jgi:uncharacterized protein YyaL (SSP411 family)
MPHGPRQPSYVATAGVAVTLGIFGLIARWVRPMIPPAGKNDMAVSRFDYLRAGGEQEIQWRSLGAQALAEARRTNRLVMMVIGERASRSARIADSDAFLDRDVVEIVRRNVIPVRVDVSEAPAWAHAYRPFSRAIEGFDQLFQVVFLAPDGEYLSQGGVSRAVLGVDRRWIQDRIDEAIRLNASRNSTNPPVNQQADDLAALSGDIVDPAFNDHVAFLRRSVHAEFGGLTFNDRQQCRPLAWRFLWRFGSDSEFNESFDPFLRSGMVDWLDGGFFREAESVQFGDISTDQVASTNADMLQLLAERYRLTKRPLDKYLAEQTANALGEAFLDGGVYRAYRVGDNGRASRSRRSSFSVRWLRAQFSPDERLFLRDQLGLRVEDNPQMMIRITDPNVISSRQYSDALRRLRLIKAEVPIAYSGRGRLDVHGFITARMTEAARLLDSENLRSRAVDNLSVLNQFVLADDSVQHLIDGGGEVCLRDYLAYADACLQDYLTFGRIEAIEEGAAVLRRGLGRFKTETPGRYDEGLWEFGDPRPLRVLSPALTDDLGESSVAMAIRLTWAYGKFERLLKFPSAKGNPLDREARVIASRFAGVANVMQNRVSGYFLAATRCRDDRVLVVVDPPDANRLADAEIAFPDRLVLPAYTHSDLVDPSLKSGLFVWSGRGFIGPLTVEAARKVLSDGT